MNNAIQLHDKTFVPFINEQKIQVEISNMAKKINSDFHSKQTVFLVVLNGAFMFASDLLKQINFNCEISFVKLQSYAGTSRSQEIQELIGLNIDVANKHVIILEDIVDTGHTIHKLIHQLNKKNVQSVTIAAALFKPTAYTMPYQVKYAAFEIENKFVVGYGLDYNGLGRNLNQIYILS